MFLKRLKKLFQKRRSGSSTINPDEIFIDATNLPKFDLSQFEGRLEKPISKTNYFVIGVIFIIFVGTFVYRLWNLEVKNGKVYAEQSENNRLRQTLIFAKRGVIYDRNNVSLAWNVSGSDEEEFLKRKYSEILGIAHIVGYLKYPMKDTSGFYYQKSFIGKDGAEKFYDTLLAGTTGLKITETDALDNIKSENVLEQPKDGENLTLSIDSRVQQKLFEIIKSVSAEYGFRAGTAVIMNVQNGELLTMVSFPEYSSEAMTNSQDKNEIGAFLKNTNNPFLNRAVSGLYIPGSIMKPYVAMGALAEKVIDPTKQILSTGSISIPNPFYPDKKSVFTDWQPQGWVDMRKALSVSSNVYFYEIGGGFEDQIGLGIERIDKYMKMFGFGEKTGIDLAGELEGSVPSPAWKKANFNGEEWRIGDTYNSSIGQYGYQVTPLQAVRGIASIANEGKLLTPSIVFNHKLSKTTRPINLSLSKEDFKVIKEGMRMGVLEGTAKNLNVPDVEVAAKTGTAELGVSKELVNSWATGFWPYSSPKYAFAVTMEKGSRHNLIGSVYVMRQLLEWMAQNTPEYFK